MSVKLAEIDQRAKSAHHRLDEIVDICEKTHNIKIPHPRYKDKCDKKKEREDGK